MARLIAITGGSGAGKSCIADALSRRLGERALVIGEDDFYRCSTTISGFDAAKHNFDAPSAKDEAALKECLSLARAGKSFEKPLYDMTTHTRRAETERIAPPDIVIVEGIHVLAFPALRPLFDLTVYVEADESLRLGRRMIRDMETRGRTGRSVLDQFFMTVRPMHEAHIAPLKHHVDLVLASEPEHGLADADAQAALILERLGL